jgi:hypothetical protein
MTMPPQLQQPPAPQYGAYPPQYAPTPAPPPGPKLAGSALLGATSVIATIVGLSVDEGGTNQWSRVHAWGVLAIAAAVLTLVPAFGRAVGIVGQRAREFAAAGAGGLVLFWVLFTLPYVGSNTSLVVTIGVAAGCAATWSVLGRTGERQPSGW